VIGIVASRLVERFYKPTVVFCLEGDKMTGSARSVQGFDLYNALQQCADTIEQFGGHKFAAGLTLKASAYEDFCQRFEEAVAATLEPWQQRPSLPIDLEMPLEVITPKFFRILKQFAPFGQGNRQPVFCSRGVYASPGSPRIVGQNHLSLSLQQKDGRTSLPAIAFGQAALLPLLAKGLPFDIAYSLDENFYRGQSDMQLRILDLRPCGE
jgi:single-stranded-DNA-specific exonuclease